jgi:DNA-binding SARP family transcriptional activator
MTTPQNGTSLDLRVLGTIELSGAPDGDAILSQPKRLAVLLYLVLATPRGFHRRDKLLGLFWEDSDQERARGSLRKALHAIRQALGDGVLVTRGDDDVAIADGTLRCDAIDFDNAESRGEYARMLELYRGDLLEGFFTDAPGFERWLEEARARRQESASRAAWSMAERSETGSDLTLAAHWARQAARLVRGDERRIRKVMMLLNRAGDRAGAIEVYESFAKLLRDDLEVDPSPETQTLAAQIRGA